MSALNAPAGHALAGHVPAGHVPADWFEGAEEPFYPDSDGQPMAENTKQFDWIVTIKANLDACCPDFVAGDLLWYPVKGHPEIRYAPDVMVALGRPKGHRGSYRQWVEAGIAPQVVFEILSPGNTVAEMIDKGIAYALYGVDEFYMYDPDLLALRGWVRGDGGLLPIASVSGWTSPHLGVRFELTADGLVMYRPNGERFLTAAEMDAQRLAERQRADTAEQRAGTAEQRAGTAEQRAGTAEQRADTAEQRADTAEQRAVAAERELAALRAMLAERSA